jgi:hypothetical protein
MPQVVESSCLIRERPPVQTPGPHKRKRKKEKKRKPKQKKGWGCGSSGGIFA